MAVTRLSQSSLREGLEKYTTALGNYVPTLGVLDNLQTVTVGAGGTSTVTFSSIPQNFQHLQVRCMFSHATANLIDDTRWRWNSDSTVANYYTVHQLRGDGSAAAAVGFNPGVAYSYLGFHSPTASNFTVLVVDILDYTNTAKNKVIRSFGGYDANGSGYVLLRSSLWLNTAAITSFSVDMIQSGNFSQHSTFSLYGVVAR